MTDLKARVGYLEIEAQQNIELQSEMQQNWYRVSAEYRKLQQDLKRVSMECNELRQTVRDLVQFRRWEELRRQGEEDDRRDLKKLGNTRTVAAEQRVREQITQLRADLEHELLTPVGNKSTHIEAKTTPSPVPMDIEKPTIEELLEILEPNGGLNESRHAPGSSQGTVLYDKPRYPPTGPKE
jgi:predicted nuclease with TOPRIM domain